MNVEIQIDMKAECLACGKELRILHEGNIRGNEVIKIAPCTSCMADAKLDGFDRAAETARQAIASAL